MKKKNLLAIQGAALLLAALSSSAFAAEPPDSWTVSVQQDRKPLQPSPKDGKVRLRRAPFSLAFTGPKDMGFGILAASNCLHLEGLLRRPNLIGEAIRPTNIAAEGAAAGNTFLTVNAPAVIEANEATAHAWGEDDANDIHSFQQVKPAPAGRATATRAVETILDQYEASKSRALPVARYPHAEI